eukprot:323057_1
MGNAKHKMEGIVVEEQKVITDYTVIKGYQWNDQYGKRWRIDDHGVPKQTGKKKKQIQKLSLCDYNKYYVTMVSDYAHTHNIPRDIITIVSSYMNSNEYILECGPHLRIENEMHLVADHGYAPHSALGALVISST